MNQLLLTPDEAARALAVTRTRVYQLMAEGSIAYVRLGRRRRIPIAALEEFVAGLQLNQP